MVRVHAAIDDGIAAARFFTYKDGSPGCSHHPRSPCCGRTWKPRSLIRCRRRAV